MAGAIIPKNSVKHHIIGKKNFFVLKIVDFICFLCNFVGSK